MADNTTLPGTGNVVATDDIAGVHYQIIKPAFGALDTATLVSTANPFPVVFATAPTTPVTGTFWQATQPVSFTWAGLTDTQLRATALPVSGTFFQATQPVSIASMPSTPVTGTFWQATQPVSLASTTVTGSVAVTGPVTDTQLRATAVPVSGAVIATPPVNSSAGPTTFTASDAVVGAPDGVGTLVSGASTAGSIVAVAVPNGFTAWTVLLKNWVNGTVYTEASFNSTNGTDGDWIDVKGRRTGTSPGVESVVYALVANGYYRGNAAGFTYFRCRFIGTTFPTVQISLTKAAGAVFLNSGIPGGSSAIGSVTVTSAPTTPVTGTFFQATQPVSLASTTVTGSVAVTGPLTDVQLRTTAVPVSLTSTTVTGSVSVTNAGTFATQATLAAETTKVIGTVNLSAAQTLATVTTVSAVTAITNALPTGANVIGAVAQSGTWTVQPGNTANTTPWLIAGGAASGTTKAGNPVQFGGVFNTTQPTVTTGQAVEVQASARGALIVTPGVDNSTTNAWFTKITDGTNTASIKAASTASAFTDAAAVVDIRPGGVLAGMGAVATTGDTGAKTATGNGATVANSGNKGVQIVIALGVVTGTTPTAVFKVQTSVDGGTTWVDLPGATTASLVATGNWGITIYPGQAVTAGTTTTGTTATVSGVIPRSWRVVWTIGGTTPSFTITSITYNYLPN